MLMDFSSFLSICLLPALKPSQAIQLGSTLTYPDYATLNILICPVLHLLYFLSA